MYIASWLWVGYILAGRAMGSMPVTIPLSIDATAAGSRLPKIVGITTGGSFSEFTLGTVDIRRDEDIYEDVIILTPETNMIADPTDSTGYLRMKANRETGKIAFTRRRYWEENFSSFLLVPNTGYELIINPGADLIAEKCMHAMSFVEIISSYFWMVNVVTDVVRQSDGAILALDGRSLEYGEDEGEGPSHHILLIDLASEYDMVAPVIYSEILAQAAQIGMTRRSSVEDSLLFTNCDEAHMNRLPLLRYHLHGPNPSGGKARLELYPEDYIVRRDGSAEECEVMLQTTLSASSTARHVGANIFRNIAIFFDRRDDGMIGLCDPRFD